MDLELQASKHDQAIKTLMAIKSANERIANAKEDLRLWDKGQAEFDLSNTTWLMNKRERFEKRLENLHLLLERLEKIQTRIVSGIISSYIKEQIKTKNHELELDKSI